MRIPSRTGVTAGVTAGSQEKRAPSRRVRRATVAALVATGLVSSSVLMPGLAAAAVPTFPDNLVVFPDRDFVTIEGYQDHVGEEATRRGQARGARSSAPRRARSRRATSPSRSTTPAATAGAPAPNLKVTPDIQPGRPGVASRFASGGTPPVTRPSRTPSSTPTRPWTRPPDPDHHGQHRRRRRTRPRSSSGSSIPTSRTPTSGGATSARSPAAAESSRRPSAGGRPYSSDLDDTPATASTPRTSSPTPATAQIAAGGGGERFMSWQVEDADANRQGLTIAEYGELGGPGMGGCPAGPADVGARDGAARPSRSGRPTRRRSQVKWTPADRRRPAPRRSPATTSPSIATAVNGSAAGRSASRTRRQPPRHDRHRARPRPRTYDVEVRSLAGAKAG